MTEYEFVPRSSQKCVSGAYDIQTFLVLVSRDLRLVAVNMHNAKFTPWTPKLQILAKTLPIPPSLPLPPLSFLPSLP